MPFDFELLLVTAVVASGFIWALDAWVFAPRRRALTAVEEGSDLATGRESADAGSSGSEVRTTQQESVLVEYARSFFPVLLAVLLLRSFLVEPFRIPSGSMMPTLLVGDFILVNKFAYGVRLPVINTKIVDVGAPERGDVAVFRFPDSPNVDYIKRVIGLPGDSVVYRNKTLFVNGERVPQKTVTDLYIGSAGQGRGNTAYSHRIENLTGVEHEILIDPKSPNRFPPSGMSWRVPQGHYFVMGDNRDNSNDSRIWGFVPESHLVGEAILIWMSWGKQGVVWTRIGNGID